jgi:hypothetical protein
MRLDGVRSLSSYGIGKESTVHLVLLLVGGAVYDRPMMAYAVVLHSWPGNMSVRFHVSECNISSLINHRETRSAPENQRVRIGSWTGGHHY